MYRQDFNILEGLNSYSCNVFYVVGIQQEFYLWNACQSVLMSDRLGSSSPSIIAQCLSMETNTDQNTDQNPGIHPKYLSMLIIDDQCRSIPLSIEKN